MKLIKKILKRFIKSEEQLSYHDVEVQFDGQRIRLFDASYSLMLTCTRAGGWRLYTRFNGEEKLLAGEYDNPPLEIFINGIQVLHLNDREEP